MAKTLVIVEALFLRESLRSLGGCGVIKHRVHLVMLRRIELEQPESGLRTLGEGSKVMRIAKDFDAGLGAENNVVACLLSLANAKQSAMWVRNDKRTVRVHEYCKAIIRGPGKRVKASCMRTARCVAEETGYSCMIFSWVDWTEMLCFEECASKFRSRLLPVSIRDWSCRCC